LNTCHVSGDRQRSEEPRPTETGQVFFPLLLYYYCLAAKHISLNKKQTFFNSENKILQQILLSLDCWNLINPCNMAQGFIVDIKYPAPYTSYLKKWRKFRNVPV
jgi:hypothetical protein